MPQTPAERVGTVLDEARLMTQRTQIEIARSVRHSLALSEQAAHLRQTIALSEIELADTRRMLRRLRSV